MSAAPDVIDLDDLYDRAQTAGAAGDPTPPPGLTPAQRAVWDQGAAAGASKSSPSKSSPSKSSPSKSSPSKSSASKSSPSKSSPSKSKRRARRRRVTTPAANAVVRPIERQTGQALRFLTLSGALVVLYVALESAGAVGGVFGGASKALRWLADPHSSIPYKS